MMEYNETVMKEIWKDIKGYEGLYQVSDFGNVKSLDRTIYFSDGRKRNYSGKEYRKLLFQNGYYYTVLFKNSSHKKVDIHKLVYETFNGEVPEGFEVHHKNHNKLDNRLENLEIINITEHRKKHMEEHKDKLIKTHSKSIVQYTLDGKFVAEYTSAAEAQRKTGIAKTHISEVANCKMKYNNQGKKWIPRTASGYVWRYKEKMEEVNMTSDIDVPMMTGALDWSGITETNLVEDEKRRID